MAESGHIKDQEGERRRFTARVLTLFLLALAGIFGLIARMVQLQVLDYEKYSTRSEENRIQVQPLPPPRGLIFDRNGVLLADNRPVFSLNLVVERIARLEPVLEALKDIVAITETDLETFRRRLSRPRRPFEPVPLKYVLSEEEIAAVAVNRPRLPGVVVEAQLVRHYPYGALTAHAVGSVRRISEDDVKRLDPIAYSGTQFVGKLGVERFYERSLHGEVGYQQVEVDARGRVRKVLAVQPAVSGHHVTVQLDLGLQRAAVEALGERRGAIVAIEPKTGGILALVSNPGYDPNLFVTGIAAEQYRELTTARERPMFNRALNGQYAPGSTFKPIVGLAGLATGATTWERTIRDPGYFRIPGQTRQYRDWSWRRGNSGGQGIVDLHRAIYRSSNTYFYEVAWRMKIEEFVGFVAQFGYGRNTAFDIVDASDGLLPTPAWKRGAKGEPWYPGDNVNLGIGQGDLLVTPLQLATAVSIIANRGRFVRPRMLLSSDRPLAEDDPGATPTEIAGVGPQDWERLVDAMEDVVHRGGGGYGQSGTAWYYIGQKIPYRMAGKSGTSQVVGIQQGEEYDEKLLDEYQRKHAWFVAFAPADAPEIALAVLVENGGGGSAVAAPVARAVIDAYLLPRLETRQVAAQ